MEFIAKQGSLTETKCDVLIVNLFEGVEIPGGGTGAVDKALGGAISARIKEEEFKGKLGDIMIVRPCNDFPAKNVLVVGLGDPQKTGVIELMRAAASAGRKCRDLRAKSVASILHGAGIGGFSAFDSARATVLGTLLGTYEFTCWKTEDVKENPIETFEIVELSADKQKEIERGIMIGEVEGDAITFSRNLGNEPSNTVTPTYLAELAQSIARDNGMDCRVLDRKGIEDAGMGLFAAVARGASTEPRFIELKYKAPNAKKTVAIIGKGITFDTGGYSLKSQGSMYGMKGDMSGAGTVISVMRALSKLKPEVNVIALVAATENAIGPNAIHPGDVFKSLNGKTVEVNNTDAEGRVTLGDVVAHAKNLGADEIIDLATLTGACVTALGREISGIIGNNQELIDSLIAAGKSCDEKMWQLPLHMDYREHLKSDVADIKNTEGGGAGSIMGALFIHSFVGDTPWAHIDMSAADIDKDLPLAKKGSVGFGTGTLIEYLISQ